MGKYHVEPLGRYDLVEVDPSANPPQPMSVVLYFDTEDGELEIVHRHQIDRNSTPMRVWHGIVKAFGIPCTADGEELTSGINNGEYDHLLNAIMDGTEIVWDGSNHVGRSNEAAEQAKYDLEVLLQDLAFTAGDNAGVWEADDWFQYNSAADLGVTVESTDDELDALVEKLEREAKEDEGAVLAGTERYLRHLRDRLIEESQADEDTSDLA